MIDLGRTRPEGCLSDRALDMMIAGELPAAHRAAVAAHLPECSACQARYQSLRAGAAAFPLEAPSFQKLIPPARRRRWWWALAPALAAAALVLVVARPRPDALTERSKGGESLGFFVLHDGSVREGASGEVVRPGDRLQLVTTTKVPRYVAVLDRDAGGRVSVFFPREAEAARREAGRAVPLPYSVELDAAIGVATIYGIFCEQPVVVSRLRQSLERQGEPTAWPRGCYADQLRYETRAP
jgi:Domain of unknown function (DUF4384)